MMCEKPDGLQNPLGPARGIFNAFLYSIPIWALILLAAYLLTTMMAKGQAV